MPPLENKLVPVTGHQSILFGWLKQSLALINEQMHASSRMLALRDNSSFMYLLTSLISCFEQKTQKTKMLWSSF